MKTDAAATFNQVNPPRGTVITFSTAPGRYAIAPLSADESILVQELRKPGTRSSRPIRRRRSTATRDAAYRVGQMFEQGTNGVSRDERKMIQWLRHASELKNGIASYQLYVFYRDRQMDRDAVRYENLARDQGYTPPRRLDTRRG